MNVPDSGALRSRLPWLICLLIAGMLASFLWAAFAEVERTLRTAAGERMTSTAQQVISLLTPGIRPRIDELRRLADGPALRAYLTAPGAETRVEAERALATVSGTGRQTVELWTAGKQRVLAIANPSADGRTLTTDMPPAGDGVLPLQTAGDGTVFTTMAVPVGALGSVVLRRPLQVNPPNIFNRLAGPEVRISIGNTTDGIWSDFSRAVPAPPIPTTVAGVFEATRPDGNTIGALTLIPSSPLAVWVELPTAAVLAPAYRFLQRMLFIGTIFVGVAIGLVQTWNIAMRRSRREAQQDLDRFFSVSIDLLCISGFDGRFRRVNPAWERVLGWSEQDLTAKPYIDFIHPDDRIATAAEASRLSEGMTTVAFENRYRCKDGSHRWLSWKAAKGGPDAIYAAARDVTDEKRAAAELRRQAEALTIARGQAERANEAKNVFLSHMSHDLRTPLNSILGFAQLLDIEELDEEKREHVRQILSGGRHLLELITDVLDISRIDSGQLSLSLEPVAVLDVVDRATALVKPLAAPSRISVQSDASVDEAVVVLADRHRLNQIVLNFLSNAVKYNRPDGAVTISALRPEPDRVRLCVSDTGEGIPEEKRPLLFQPFERLGAEFSAVEGTGLGLALSRALAEAMKGSVGVANANGGGSTFWVELPAASLPESLALPSRPAAPIGTTVVSRNATIIYVEDNRSNVRLMQGILRQRPSITLLHAPSGEVGLSMIAEHRPNLVLLDLHLPDISGEEVVRRLRKNPATDAIPVVIATADASPGVTKRMQAAGATACLSKPLEVQRVLELIDDLV